MGIDWFSNSYSALDSYRYREKTVEDAKKKAINEIRKNGWGNCKKLAYLFQLYYKNNSSYKSKFCSVYYKQVSREKADANLVTYVKNYIRENKQNIKGFLADLAGAEEKYQESPNGKIEAAQTFVDTNIDKILNNADNKAYMTVQSLVKKHPVAAQCCLQFMSKRFKVKILECCALESGILYGDPQPPINLERGKELLNLYRDQLDRWQTASLFIFGQASCRINVANFANWQSENSIDHDFDIQIANRYLSEEAVLGGLLHRWWNVKSVRTQFSHIFVQLEKLTENFFSQIYDSLQPKLASYLVFS